MTVIMPLTGLFHRRQKESPPSPIPEAAKQAKRIADEAHDLVTAVTEIGLQLERQNDVREAKLNDNQR